MNKEKKKFYGLLVSILLILPSFVSVYFIANLSGINTGIAANSEEIEEPVSQLDLTSATALIDIDPIDLDLIKKEEIEPEPDPGDVISPGKTDAELAIINGLSDILDEILPEVFSTEANIPDLPDDLLLQIAQELNFGKQPAGKQTVIQNDDRTLVNASSYLFPWVTICKLQMTANDMSSWIGSGAIIGNRHVLTAGHCVYDAGTGGWMNSILVTPGMACGASVVGTGMAYTADLWSYAGWVNDGLSEYDMGWFTIDTNLGATTGWMGFKVYNYTDPVYTGIVNTAGYPADLGGWCMYYDWNYSDHATELQQWYWVDTYGGQSGSPVWRLEGGDRWILAVHAYGGGGYPNPNYGTRLTQERINDLLWFTGYYFVIIIILLLILFFFFL